MKTTPEIITKREKLAVLKGRRIELEKSHKVAKQAVERIASDISTINAHIANALAVLSYQDGQSDIGIE